MSRPTKRLRPFPKDGFFRLDMVVARTIAGNYPGLGASAKITYRPVEPFGADGVFVGTKPERTPAPDGDYSFQVLTKSDEAVPYVFKIGKEVITVAIPAGAATSLLELVSG